MKFCHKCQTLKSTDEFNKCKGKKDGLESNCRNCKKQRYINNREHAIAQVKKRYAEKRDEILLKKNERYSLNKEAISNKRKVNRLKNPGVEAAYQKKKRTSIKLEAIKKLGGSCSSCGNSDFNVLCVDHILNDGKNDRSEVSQITMLRQIAKHGSQGKYQCLCWNCNLKKEILKNRLYKPTGKQKKCLLCNVFKDTCLFKRYKRSLDGLSPHCRKCFKEKLMNLRMEAMSYIGELICSCGVSDPYVLSIDHINEDGSRDRIVGEKLYNSIIHGNQDLSRLQILCMNCNLAKHFQYKNISPHIPIGAPVGVSRTPSLTSLDLLDFDFKSVTFQRLLDIETSREFLDKFHYAGFGRGGTAVYGVFLDSELIGVVKFASAIRQGVANTLGVQNNELLELDRFCIHPARHKKNFASFIMKRVIKTVKSDFPSVKKLVSFADPRAGHIGHIYKASNWIYDGKTTTSYYYEDRDGNEVNKKTLYQWAKKQGMKERECYESLGYKKIQTPPKFKYHYNI